MSDDKGRCPLCGGEKHPGTTTFAVDLKSGVVVVRDVPALVCSQCGDAWLEDPVAEGLQKIVDNARCTDTEVSVTRWRHVA
ncbi:MAG: YgiT-type zinc finger domain-containing protein [Deltaproteobacteria bacterium]|nr:MAG: YgiT-type zinc finger domain-containing protein [Deltaproteobacteria bacterium]